MKKIAFLFLIGFAFVACKRKTVEGPQGPQGPAGSLPTGSIYGKITLTDPNSTNTLVSLANTTVSIVDQTVSAVTDAKGSYTISNVLPGMIDIIMTTEDGTVGKWQQYSFAGNKGLINATLSKKITEVVTGSIIDTIIGGKKGLYIRAVFNPTITNSRSLVLLIGSTDKMNPYDARTFQFNNITFCSGSNLKLSYFHEYDSIKLSYPFKNGQQIFVNAYPIPYNNFAYWDVYAEGNVFYNAGNPIAPTYSAIVQ